MDEHQDQNISEPRRHPTLKMATLAVHNMLASAASEQSRAGMKDLASEILLPVSSLLLILAICLPAQPLVKALSFVVPLAALAYYMYRRIGIITTFNSRQAYVTRCLLLATFMTGGTFALFFVYVMAYVLKTVAR